MKKGLIIFLIVFFTVTAVGNGYSDDNKCLGPYDSETIINNYKSIIDDYYKDWVDPDDGICNPTERELLASPEILHLKLLILRSQLETLMKIRCIPSGKKQDTKILILQLNVTEKEQLKNFYELDRKGYHEWLSTKPKIAKYLQSHRGLQKVIDWGTKGMCK